jgi:hypothetical protein
MSMTWAMGVGRFTAFPAFKKAIRDLDWITAVAQCHMSETGQNASFHRRNLANAALLQQLV